MLISGFGVAVPEHFGVRQLIKRFQWLSFWVETVIWAFNVRFLLALGILREASAHKRCLDFERSELGGATVNSSV
jgi:hypothetical protein